MPVFERLLDEIVQAVAVPLLERGALGLAVVGEHDDFVRPGRVAASPVDAAELLVELPQRLERVGPLQPGVVRDLVVAREGRVDGGAAAHHVGEDAEDDQVAHDDAHRGAHERVEAAAVAARLHVPADRAQGGDPFEDHLPAEEDERPSDVERVGEESPVSRVRFLLRLDPADGEDLLVGFTGEEVAAAGSSVDEQAVAGCPLSLDPRAVGRRGARHERPGLLLDPPERGDVVVRAEQDPGLARTRLRREVGFPLREVMSLLGEPACHRRRVPVSHGPAQHRESQPVDLEEDDPRPVGSLRASLPARDPLDDLERVRVVVVRAEDHLEHDADRGDDQRREQGPAEVVDDVGAVDEIASQLQHERVEHEDEDEAERNREGKP